MRDDLCGLDAQHSFALLFICVSFAPEAASFNVLYSLYTLLATPFVSPNSLLDLTIMGAFIWHEWARFVSITASVYGVWASYWAMFYRKVFWDFVGGTLRAPGGLQPTASIIPLANVIVKIPLIQIISFVVGIGILTIELGPTFIKNTALYRTWVPRIVFLLIQAVLTAMFYQGTNAAIWSLIAIFGYVQAQVNGEELAELKQSRGRGGGSKA